MTFLQRLSLKANHVRQTQMWRAVKVDPDRRILDVYELSEAGDFEYVISPRGIAAPSAGRKSHHEDVHRGSALFNIFSLTHLVDLAKSTIE